MIIKDPYSELIKKMRNQGTHYNPPSIELGKVISVTPLTISVSDLQLTKDNLLVADYLTDLINGDLVTLVQSGSIYIILARVVVP